MAGLWARDINNPSNVMGWATDAKGGGLWGDGGFASDDTNMFVVSGEPVYKPRRPVEWRRSNRPFASGADMYRHPTDFRAPVNWQSLDNGDTDLGGCSPTLM